jgi:hypothetical protein
MVERFLSFNSFDSESVPAVVAFGGDHRGNATWQAFHSTD